ncbi:hypothetical protein NUACC26_070640 [Scytonema sp. NUACC26]
MGIGDWGTRSPLLVEGQWGLGIGDWRLAIGDWRLSFGAKQLYLFSLLTNSPGKSLGDSSALN